MTENNYLKWLPSVGSCWWCDSAVVDEVAAAVKNGATGVTTNPLLVSRSLYANPEYWRPHLTGLDGLSGDARVEEIIRRVTLRLAELLLPAYRESAGAQGYVCAQVDPNLAGQREPMLEMARRLHRWGPNIAVKLPGTAAGLDVMEACAAEGIVTVGTVSFTAAQAVAIALRQHRGALRAKRSGQTPPPAAFSVVMVGRLDDYLRDLAHDAEVPVEPEDLLWAGAAAIKRAYATVRAAGFASKLMPAGMRGTYHVLELAGADMSMSIAPAIQDGLSTQSGPYQRHIDDPIPAAALTRLAGIPEFRRAYDPEGMSPADFIAFGPTQKTLSQFIEAGWQRIGVFTCR